ncbi:diguanylate cyclase (GGDEF) domain-containing protein [Oscillibacter sp. PC13]|uniref:putative bifunctional diguanylate cyclase/phosphodiesterase n=1 Tax=Oscillibacter sp. PC13 TaxID=1855299 RepID=UPI0008EA962F|nr:EAL domain-containing response regulator [Oscillibacter sp. PC13]SFP89778.1 diguanylate cyclase (GGDEF) domain-containing protein [Oscillibacter sp. PC13]
MGKRILLIDQNDRDRGDLKRILEGQYELWEAGSAQEAFGLLTGKNGSPDAVLLDLEQPDMDGLVFLEELKKRISPAESLVFLLAEEEPGETELQALRCGITDLIQRPFHAQTILTRLGSFLGLRETASLVGQVERDSLTAFYNREGFYARLEQLLKQNPNLPVDLVAMDIGNFKLVNDLYGEQAGDELIQTVARCASGSFGKSGAILARKTGDQFLFAFPGGGVGGQWLWRESQSWEARYPIDLNLPLRFGIYTIQGLTEPVSVMCDNAKLAADSIRGRYDVHWAAYDASIRQRLLEEQGLADDLAVGLRDGQFDAWYQPKCDPATGKTVGCEALVRWNHPVLAHLRPDQFVPLFERNRLITKLDAFMWERACRDLADYRDGGERAIPLSVNVSRVDVYQKNLVRYLQDLMARRRIDPGNIVLEITESAYADDPVQLTDTVRKLREAGFRVEMDDFGSGYSSLNLLMEMPLDGVKLDLRLLQDLEKDPRRSRFLQHLMKMVMDLGLSVTAEGVETAYQAKFLQEAGCRSAQGNYYSPPLPRAEFERFLKSHG